MLSSRHEETRVILIATSSVAQSSLAFGILKKLSLLKVFNYNLTTKSLMQLKNSSLETVVLSITLSNLAASSLSGS